MVLSGTVPVLLMLARARLHQSDFQLAAGDVHCRSLAVLERELGGGVPPQSKTDSTTDRAQLLTDSACSRTAGDWEDCVRCDRCGHARRGSGVCVLSGLVKPALNLDTFPDDPPAREGAVALPNVVATVGANLGRTGFDWRSPQGSFGLARQYRAPLSLDSDQHQRNRNSAVAASSRYLPLMPSRLGDGSPPDAVAY